MTNNYNGEHIITDAHFSQTKLMALRKTTTMCGLSFFMTLVFCYQIYEYLQKTPRGDSVGGSLFLAHIPLFVFIGLSILSFAVLFGSLIALWRNRIWRQVGARDHQQDEWESMYKRKAEAAAYRMGLSGFITVYALSEIARFFSEAQSLDGNVVMIFAITYIFLMGIAPLIYLAWTLKPLTDD